MNLRIRQIVLAAHSLESVVSELQNVLGIEVCYHDPGVAKFGLENTLMVMGVADDAQFLEVVAPLPNTQANDTAAGRHLQRHGESGYMLILQTDDLPRDRKRIEQLGVRIVFEATHPDISVIHLHPKDIGATILSIDQPDPPQSWRWAGPDWPQYCSTTGAQRVLCAHISARDPAAMAQRWATVLGTAAPVERDGQNRIAIDGGVLNFSAGDSELITGFDIKVADAKAALQKAQGLGLMVDGGSVWIGGVRFTLE
jgi:hypothetical protein